MDMMAFCWCPDESGDDSDAVAPVLLAAMSAGRPPSPRDTHLRHASFVQRHAPIVQEFTHL
ncbi:hypothetical protein ADL00_02340 [Streptomyces sp. AS58]|nr:hypothetical protein ADL00_02340 [Streptomyces sp. AS58]